MGGGNQPDMRVDSAGAAQALKLLLLQHAQQLGLQFQRNVPHLVQEQRSFVGEFEAAQPLGHRASESAALVAE